MNAITNAMRINAAATVAIANTEFLPAVTIMLPFAPVTVPKKNIQNQLKKILAKVETRLMADYSVERAIPVIIKLRAIIAELNYNATKKAVVIFVSPIVERVYYLETAMQEKIVIDPHFKMCDLVRFKKEKHDFLILTLNENSSGMYLGDGTKVKLIKSNTDQHLQKLECDSTVDVNYLPEAKIDLNVHCFFTKIDQGLSLILKSYPLPVLVMGEEKLVSHFKKITRNDTNLVQTIHGNYDEITDDELNFVMEYLVNNWKLFKQAFLLQQVEKAQAEGKLRTGIKDALKASTQKKVKLLLIEKSYLGDPLAAKRYAPYFKIDAVGNEAFFIKDEMDETIKNVLSNGGDVALIDDGLLRNYRQIAFIEA